MRQSWDHLSNGPDDTYIQYYDTNYWYYITADDTYYTTGRTGLTISRELNTDAHVWKSVKNKLFILVPLFDQLHSASCLSWLDFWESEIIGQGSTSESESEIEIIFS